MSYSFSTSIRDYLKTIDLDKSKRVYSFNDIKVKQVLTNIKAKSEINLATKLTNNVNLKLPFILMSSDIDEIKDININGGLGIINKMNIDDQVEMVKKVKKHINIFNTDIITVNTNTTFIELQELFKNEQLEYVFVVDYYSGCLGMIYREHLDIVQICNQNSNVGEGRGTHLMANEIMTEISKIKYFNQYDYDWLTLIASPVQFILDQFKMSPNIPILCNNKQIIGVLSLKEFIKFYKLKDKLLFDGYGKLLAAACIGITQDYIERINKLVFAGLDILCINIDNGYNSLLFDIVKDTKQRHPNLIIIIGNINTVEGYTALKDIPVDAVVIGDGTEDGQFTLLQECKQVYNIPIINNSGIPSKNDNMFKALLAGANSILIQSDKWKDIYMSKNIIYPMVAVNIKTIDELHSANIECFKIT